jgi:hypothetical protein
VKKISAANDADIRAMAVRMLIKGFYPPPHRLPRVRVRIDERRLSSVPSVEFEDCSAIIVVQTGATCAQKPPPQLPRSDNQAALWPCIGCERNGPRIRIHSADLRIALRCMEESTSTTQIYRYATRCTLTLLPSIRLIDIARTFVGVNHFIPEPAAVLRDTTYMATASPMLASVFSVDARRSSSCLPWKIFRLQLSDV